jgi:hypothetical protein
VFTICCVREVGKPELGGWTSGPLYSAASKARDSSSTARVLGRDLFPPLHLCLRFRSLRDRVGHSYGKATMPCYVDGDPRASADSHCEVAAGACVRVVSAAQNQVRSQNPLRQLCPGLRAVCASHARPAPAAPEVSRARTVGTPSALRGPASPE